jgi:hypothetical protein
VNYLPQIPFTIPEIALVSLLYLLVDLYPQVKSFRATLVTGSFLLLWVVFSILTGIGYFFLMTTSVTNIQSLVGPVGTKLTVIVLAALVGATILQSLSLKISDVKIINVEALLNGYRAQVLADITRRNSQNERLRALHLGDRLAQSFRDRAAELEGKYAQLLLSVGQTSDDVARMIAVINEESSSLHISKVELIAGKIARLDPARAQHLLSPRSTLTANSQNAG